MINPINYFKSNKQFLYGTAVLIGTMVGVGIFGIPLAFAKSGFLVGFVFLIIIALVTLLIDLVYGEIILRTEEKHQLVGYTEYYLGPIAKRIIFFTITLSIYAALLAYMIIAGDFLHNILSSFFYVPATNYSFLFYILVSFLIFFGIKRFTWLELSLIVLFLIAVLTIFFVGVEKIDMSNYYSLNAGYWFLPYGVLMFAFAGMSGISIQRQVLKGKENKFKKSIFLAIIFTAVLYLIFAFTVVGISGESTLPDSISGLYDILGSKIVIIGSLFGILAVLSSYLMLGSALMETFSYDYKSSKIVSWLFVVIPPLILFLTGSRNFIDIISLAGSVAIGIEAITVILIYSRSKKHGDRIPEYSLNISKWWLYILMVMFLGGVIYALIS